MLREEVAGVRTVIGCLMLALVAAGCRSATMADRPTAGSPALQIQESPSPFRQVTAGPVRALIPDGWEPVPAGAADDPRGGFVARPRPGAWEDGALREGMAAVWVDGTKVGVPSDYYYLAATGPALDLITRSRNCSATRQSVIVDHAPAFADGDQGSPGDYVAHGEGTCRVGDRPTRWAYFVAAPGYGPIRELGIPDSSLYLVVAVVPDGPRAPAMLTRLLQRTRFGDASVDDLLAAARAA
jgi:hypothetical protein